MRWTTDEASTRWTCEQMHPLTRRQKPPDTPSPIVSPGVIMELPQSSLRYILVPVKMAARILIKTRVATAEKDRITLRVVCVTLRWKPSHQSLVELVSDLVDHLQLPRTVSGVILRRILSAMDELTYNVGKSEVFSGREAFSRHSSRS